MNVERLHAIIRAVVAELADTRQVEILTELEGSLTNHVNAPQDAAHQEQVAQHRVSLTAALNSAASNGFPATWRQVLDELGATGVLGDALNARIDEVFLRNQITPTVARDEIVSIAEEIRSFAEAAKRLSDSLGFFGIPAEDLDPGTAEVSVLIPRPAVADELPALGQEFRRLQSILGPFMEVFGGQRAPLKVNSISSSDFGVFVAMAPAVAWGVAVAVEKILDVYIKLLDIKRIRRELLDNDVPAEGLEGLDAHANSMMAAATEQIATELVDSAEIADVGRANELKIELRLSLNQIANRIDQGYNIDVRAEPEIDDESPDEDGADPDGGGPSETQQLIAQIREIQPKLAFLNPTGRPILSLPEADEENDQADGSESGSQERPRGKGAPEQEA